MPGPVLGIQLWELRVSEVDTVTPPLQMRKPRLSEWLCLIQGHPALVAEPGPESRRSVTELGWILPMGVWSGYPKEPLEWRHEEEFEGMGQAQVPKSTSGQGSVPTALPSSTSKSDMRDEHEEPGAGEALLQHSSGY